MSDLPAERLAEPVRIGLVSLLLGCWLLGGYAGIVYWSLQMSLLGVIVSALASAFGVATTLPLYVRLKEGQASGGESMRQREGREV